MCTTNSEKSDLKIVYHMLSVTVRNQSLITLRCCGILLSWKPDNGPEGVHYKEIWMYIFVKYGWVGY